MYLYERHSIGSSGIFGFKIRDKGRVTNLARVKEIFQISSLSPMGNIAPARADAVGDEDGPGNFAYSASPQQSPPKTGTGE